ncbi:hypothetical protein ACQ4PT_024152 [Festuca glaucescens]
MGVEVDREPRKRPREEAAEEPPTAAAPEPPTAVATDPIAAAALEEIAHARQFATVTSEYYKHVLANPLTPDQLRERDEAWEKHCSESWERFRDNFLWADENNPFEAVTKIPCMCFTFEDYTRPNYPRLVRAEDTLQIISVQVQEIAAALQRPLDVYGIVAVRDVLDRRRNMVFDRERDDFQRISEKDSYLTLTGPSRGVVMTVDPSYLEVVLKVRGAIESEDKYLSKFVREYRLGCFNPIKYTSKLCTVEMQYYTVRVAVEATISARLAEGQWPSGFRGVLTASTNCHSDVNIALLDLNDDVLPVGADGFIKMSRRVVSVKKGGKLHVSVLQRGVGEEQDPSEEEEDQVIAVTSFTAAEAETSTNFMRMKIGGCWMEVTVAWSLFSCW